MHYHGRRVDRRRPGSSGLNITCASMQETLILLLANNEGADQPAHPHSLISAFVIRYLKRLVTRSDISNCSIIFGVGFNMIKHLDTRMHGFKVGTDKDNLK